MKGAGPLVALRPKIRPSIQASMLSHERALEELARRRVRAVGRCPGCGGRVERDDDWLRLGAEAFHVACAGGGSAASPLERPPRYGAA